MTTDHPSGLKGSILINSIQPCGILSFPNDSEPFPLLNLNVLIGPNGSGKSNLIELFELLNATPTDLAGAIRDGGGVSEWLWRGGSKSGAATLSATLNIPERRQPIRYRLEFGSTGLASQRLEVFDEAIEDVERRSQDQSDVYFYYRFKRGHPVINVRSPKGTVATSTRQLERDSLDPQQSVLSQRKDPDQYPELTAVGRAFGQIQTFREWCFGRYTPVRRPQSSDLPDILLPDAINLGMVLNAIDHSDARQRFNELMRRFLPRFNRISTLVQSGTVQIFLHEDGLRSPIPATRLSDGTLRFIALLAILLTTTPAPLICIEEPELGLHPDALAIVAELLVEASQRTQIVVTTHSDALVSALTEVPQSVIVCENLAGETSLRRLNPDRLKSWLEEYRLGEIWRIGELGGNP